MFGVSFRSYTQPETALPLFFQKTMSDNVPLRPAAAGGADRGLGIGVESFRLSIFEKKPPLLSSRERGRAIDGKI